MPDTKLKLSSIIKPIITESSKPKIRVNTIAPGAVEVERNQDGLRENREFWMPKILLGRYGTTDEIGELAVFLSSDAAAWMTGQVLTIDGGTTARGNYPKK
ncbi:SDR family oxidoreductase [Lyngbya sp. CCY1209]|uniref:SDR family NAD(P)-dependent oxidoreductase n=1 Tax=Lyngbya sp. CCY1209 TaxID=2886103 RepID=UPI002D20D1A9|nr:SDR family oxidoreductase [Lyngbya sp. CCY1209]MEB3886666.1 SDR family oxidoreductase [Lyngbya sp. CCY1209]